MNMFLKYSRHKVDLDRCFTFNLKVDQIVGQIKAFHTNPLKIRDSRSKTINCILKLKARNHYLGIIPKYYKLFCLA